MPPALNKKQQQSSLAETAVSFNDGGPMDSSLSNVRKKARVAASGWLWFFTHLSALLKKRLLYAMRDRRALCCQLVLPIALIALGLALMLLATNTVSRDWVLSTSDFNGGKAPNLVPRFDFKATGSGSGISSPSISTLLKSSPAFTPADTYSSAASAVTLTQAQALAQVIPTGLTPTTSMTSPTKEFQQMSAFLLETQASYASSKYGALVFTRDNTVFPFQNATAVPPSSAGVLTCGIFVNTTSSHAPAIWLNALDSAMLSTSGGGAGKTITTHNAPLPRTYRQVNLFSNLLVFAASLIMVIAFAFVASNAALYIVREREVSAKHQQLISGVSVSAYWVSNFIFDYSVYLIPAVVAMLLCKAFNVDAFISTDKQQLSALIANFLLFGLASITSTYLLCFFFKSPSAAQGTVLFLNIFAIILITASQFLSQLTSTCKAETSLRYVFGLLPSFNFGFVLIQLSFLDSLPLLEATCAGGKITNLVAYQALDIRATGALLAYMGVEFVVYCALILGVEYVQSRPAFLQWLFPDPKLPLLPPPSPDPDVMREVARMEAQFSPSGVITDAIAINKVRKVYKGGKVAVHDLSFGVATGEVFGFLGINGAGKTTTLQILSGDVVPTSGTACMAGFDIMTEQPEVRRLLGYCPQFDSLIDLLTVREHLELFARIKGVPEASVPSTVARKIAELDLTHFAGKTAGSLSGGNKRKLCVAIALIGDPPLVFLDEPSTGMDPQAKRFMWGVVNRVASEQKLCSIILTTHSMEEVEALCSKIGIMVGGRLRCLGSAQHLKNTHGKSYTVQIRMGTSAISSVACDAVEQVLARGGMSADLNREEVVKAASTLGDPSALEELSEMGQGWSIAAALNSTGVISRTEFAVWWVGEQAQRKVISHFLGGPGRAPLFQDCSLTERQGSLISISIPNTGEPLASMFSKIEQAKVTTNLDFEASLGQVVRSTNVFPPFAPPPRTSTPHAHSHT